MLSQIFFSGIIIFRKNDDKYAILITVTGMAVSSCSNSLRSYAVIETDMRVHGSL